MPVARKATIAVQRNESISIYFERVTLTLDDLLELATIAEAVAKQLISAEDTLTAVERIVRHLRSTGKPVRVVMEG